MHESRASLSNQYHAYIANTHTCATVIRPRPDNAKYGFVGLREEATFIKLSLRSTIQEIIHVEGAQVLQMQTAPTHLVQLQQVGVAVLQNANKILQHGRLLVERLCEIQLMQRVDSKGL